MNSNEINTILEFNNSSSEFSQSNVISHEEKEYNIQDSPESNEKTDANLKMDPKCNNNVVKATYFEK